MLVAGTNGGVGRTCSTLRRAARSATRHGGGPSSIASTSSSSSNMNRTTITQVRHSHVGKAPLYISPSTKLDVLPFAPIVDPLKRQPKALQKARSIAVQGPRGTVIVPLHECVEMEWDKEAETNAADEEEFRKLSLRVRDSTEAKQRKLWGLTRSLLANAVEGVQEGHSRVLRLVGVGYRAVVENDPFPRPDKFERAFASIAEQSLFSSASAAAALGNFSSAAQRDYYAKLFNLASAGAEAATGAPTGTAQRLSLRLGYSHPIYMTIPRGVTCTTPQPTRILLQGPNNDVLGLFAAQIRKWRPPEPYKGKGVFVDDETIKLKPARKK